jgi:hypothetical protein
MKLTAKQVRIIIGVLRAIIELFTELIGEKKHGKENHIGTEE